MIHSCPIDDCDSVHDTKGGVVQHLFMSQQGDHDDIEDKGEAWALVNDESSQGGDDADNGDGDDDGHNPVIDGGPPEFESDPDPETSELSCGCVVEVATLDAGTYQCQQHHTRFEVGA
jgi:hypothetical protein